ncbi:phosphohistidine phosphatase SixA [Salinimonas sediminis]|uniref:Phosphohistidine phosphatase SixA n=1 Tax=Salinimonas sediminis TaxID=2303538 RepID=A0A346NK56_9ALTE|nr:phosphohistidine phosphatase SixA [Salinimonas sediminis]AXR05913.1 phosphohistidine phosphatase SixA [Salinimonas sediminis]
MSRQSSDSILLFIMRHGEAEALRRDDKSRNLTSFGCAQAVSTSKWLVKYTPAQQIDLALVSPYQRTRQTFDMMTVDNKFSDMEVCDDIVPDGDVHIAHDYIDAILSQSRYKGLDSLLLVSHMPFVSYFTDEVCRSHRSALFATGSVAVIRYNVRRHQGELIEHYQGQ